MTPDENANDPAISQPIAGADPAPVQSDPPTSVPLDTTPADPVSAVGTDFSTGAAVTPSSPLEATPSEKPAAVSPLPQPTPGSVSLGDESETATPAVSSPEAPSFPSGSLGAEAEQALGGDAVPETPAPGPVDSPAAPADGEIDINNNPPAAPDAGPNLGQ